MRMPRTLPVMTLPVILVWLGALFSLAAASSGGGGDGGGGDGGGGSGHAIRMVFTRAETDLCGYEHGIRIPQLAATPSGVLAFGQCRNAAQGTGRPENIQGGPVGDDMSHTKIVSKFSSSRSSSA